MLIALTIAGGLVLGVGVGFVLMFGLVKSYELNDEPGHWKDLP